MMNDGGRGRTGVPRKLRIGVVVNAVLFMIVAVETALPALLGAQEPVSAAAPSGEVLTLPEAVSMALRRNRDIVDPAPMAIISGHDTACDVVAMSGRGHEDL